MNTVRRKNVVNEYFKQPQLKLKMLTLWLIVKSVILLEVVRGIKSPNCY